MLKEGLSLGVASVVGAYKERSARRFLGVEWRAAVYRVTRRVDLLLLSIPECAFYELRKRGIEESLLTASFSRGGGGAVWRTRPARIRLAVNAFSRTRNRGFKIRYALNFVHN